MQLSAYAIERMPTPSVQLVTWLIVARQNAKTGLNALYLAVKHVSYAVYDGSSYNSHFSTILFPPPFPGCTRTVWRDTPYRFALFMYRLLLKVACQRPLPFLLLTSAIDGSYSGGGNSHSADNNNSRGYAKINSGVFARKGPIETFR